MTKYGYFNYKPQAEWLSDGRSMKILKDFIYYDQDGVTWTAPAGSIVNGASIPRFFWRFIGGPFEGKYRNASIIHDVYCETRFYSSKEVHRMFYNAMRCGGVGPIKAFAMWLAVRVFGPRF